MRYRKVTVGRFIDRPNRFIAHVAVDGRVETVHVKNTGRCRELLVSDAVVYLEKAGNPDRKTPYDLIAVEKGGRLINMDSTAPNRVFAEWAAAGHFPGGAAEIRAEVTYGASRFDFSLQSQGKTHFVEVKGVTLEIDGIALFPDAHTERGVKHIRELQRAVREGFGATIFFVVQMAEADCFLPNDATHPAFGAALREAAQNGVNVIAYDCSVTPDALALRREVPVRL